LYDLSNAGSFSEFIELFPEIKKSALAIYHIYTDEIYPDCKDVTPLINERIRQVYNHMSTVEYFLMFSLRLYENYDLWDEKFTRHFQTCRDDGPFQCGITFGGLINEVFFWDFKIRL
jgi:hypothetical protein